MATKYELSAMKRAILDMIKLDWPCDLLQWIKVSRTMRNVEPASLLYFANRYQLKDVRAAALYLLAHLEGNWDKLKRNARWHLVSKWDHELFIYFMRPKLRDLRGRLVTHFSPCSRCRDKVGYITMRQKMELEFAKKRDCLTALYRYLEYRKGTKPCPECYKEIDAEVEDFWKLVCGSEAVEITPANWSNFSVRNGRYYPRPVPVAD